MDLTLMSKPTSVFVSSVSPLIMPMALLPKPTIALNKPFIIIILDSQGCRSMPWLFVLEVAYVVLQVAQLLLYLLPLELVLCNFMAVLLWQLLVVPIECLHVLFGLLYTYDGLTYRLSWDSLLERERWRDLLLFVFKEIFGRFIRPVAFTHFFRIVLFK